MAHRGPRQNQSIHGIPPHAAAAGTNQGGRKRGRRGGRRQNEAGAGVPSQIPRFLATRSTPEMNDPLWTTGLPGFDLWPEPGTESVYSSAEALRHVVMAMHTAYFSSSNAYARLVSESMLSYYAAVLVWKRMLSLQRRNGSGLRSEEVDFVEQVDTLNLEVPVLLAHYLAGFGNTQVPCGRQLSFQLRKRRRYLRAGHCSGFFGRINAKTQPLYQNYPCLGVYAARILASLEDGDVWWNLPAEVVPTISGGIRASPALLGYDYRDILSAGQREFLRSCKILPDTAFPSVHASLPLCGSLLLSIQSVLRQVSSMRLSPQPSGIIGSQAQLAWVTVNREFNQRVQGVYELHCVYKLASEVALPASAFIYRVNHDVEGREVGEDAGGNASWVVWKYEADHADDWAPLVAAGNDLRMDEPEFINISEFAIGPYDISTHLRALEQAINGAGYSS